jgi:hypothetical protein
VQNLASAKLATKGDQLSQINATNLDDSGRAFLSRVRQVFTTEVGAQRLGGNAVGLAPWETEKFALVE